MVEPDVVSGCKVEVWPLAPMRQRAAGRSYASFRLVGYK